MFRPTSLALAASLAFAAPTLAADRYEVDKEHAVVVFRVKHLGISYFYGRFDQVTGTINLDANDASKSSIEVKIPAASANTNNKKRDDHVKSPDFLNAKEFPFITFKSTKVSKKGDDYQVEGNLYFLGKTKEVTLIATKTGEGKDPWGGYRIGFEAKLTIKRSDFGNTKLQGAVGDEIDLMIALEGIRE